MEKLESIDVYKSKKDIDHELLKDYVKALKDEEFKRLVARLGVNEDIAKKYTSKLERSVCELKNCANCQGLVFCKNAIAGCVYYPKKEDDKLRFNYVACRYKQEEIALDGTRSITFEEPYAIKNARLADIDLTDKKRAKVIKWINSFYKEYEKNAHIKGIYLHGSFGSGKTYLLAALLNELAKKKVKTIIIYYPEMLRILKASFSDDFEEKMHDLKTCDILLIDDIGAESVTPWSRDEILGTILQYRMDACLPTFLTSNLTIEELESHLSQTKNGVDVIKARRIIERIKQLTVDMELISENRRK